MTEPSGSVATIGRSTGAGRRAARAAIFVTAGAVLVVSLFMGWYLVGGSSNACNANELLYPFWVTVSSSGSYCPAAETGSFSAAGLPVTGVLYLAVAALSVAAAFLAFFAAGLLLVRKWDYRSRGLLIVVLAALVIGAAAPTMVALGQPSTVCSDQGFKSIPFVVSLASGSSPSCNGWSFWSGNGTSWTWTGNSGPWHSFFGSTVLSDASFAWGPSTGWFFDLWGLALLGIGIYALRKKGGSEPGGKV